MCSFIPELSRLPNPKRFPDWPHSYQYPGLYNMRTHFGFPFPVLSFYTPPGWCSMAMLDIALLSLRADLREASVPSTREQGDIRFIAAFDATLVVGWILLVLTIVPPLVSSRIIPRLSSWFAMLLSGQVYCLSFLLLVGFQKGPAPPFELCLLQTCLIYCCPILTASYTLTFIIELFNVLYQATRSIKIEKSRAMLWILAIPAILYAIVFIVVLVSGVRNPETIERNLSHTFCHSTLAFPGYLTAIIVFSEFIAMLVLEAVMFYMLRLKKKDLESCVSPDTKSYTDFSFVHRRLFLRTVMFSVYTGLGAFISAFVLLSPSSIPILGWVFMLTLPPMVAVSVFGTQTDIYQFYVSAILAGWRKLFPLKL